MTVHVFYRQEGRQGPGLPFYARALAARVAPEERERKTYLDRLWICAQSMLNDPSSKTAVQALATTLRVEPEVNGVQSIPARQGK